MLLAPKGPRNRIALLQSVSWQADVHEGCRLPHVVGCVALFVAVAFDPTSTDAFALPKQLVLVALTCMLVAVGEFHSPKIRASRGAACSRRILLLMAALLAWEAFAALTSGAGAATVFGVPGYRQGLVSHICIAVIFLSLASHRLSYSDYSVVRGYGVYALMLVAAYGLVQRLGLDPIDWSTDSLISSMGNSNDLALFAIGSLAFADFLHRPGRTMAVRGSGFVATVSWIVLSTGGTSALVAYLFALASVLILLAVQRSPRGAVARATGRALAGSLAATIIVALSASSNARPPGSDTANAAVDLELRTAIWRASLHELQGSWLTGLGPTGIYRLPATDEPLAQHAQSASAVSSSPHSVLLEIPMAVGAIGAFIVLVLLILTVHRLLLTLGSAGNSGGPPLPYLGAGMAGVVLMELVNPLPLQAGVALAIMAGLVWGATTSSTTRPNFTC